jgi:mycobactin salicyl-AMP ligase
VVDADGPQRLTFAQLDERADRAAAGLSALGIAFGDRVLLQLPNGCEFAVALFGLLRAGAIPVMCLTGQRAAELGRFATVSAATALIIPATAAGFDYRPMAQQLTQEHPGLKHVVVDGEPGPFASWSHVSAYHDDRPATSTPDPSSPALLLVSGGTTGLPKLIPRTHNDYVYNATASAELCELTSDDVYLAALPSAHNFPLACPGLLGAIAVASWRHRHRAGAGIGQAVGPSHRVGARGADIVAAAASRWREVGGQRCPAGP